MGLFKRWKRKQLFRRLVTYMCLLVPVFCILVLLTSDLPDTAPKPWSRDSSELKRTESAAELGELGLSMIGMLPDNLTFTSFVPTEETFDRVLNLRSNRSLMPDKINDTSAILSRVMGFCTVPQHILSESVVEMKELQFDSVSGFGINVRKEAPDENLLANNIRSARVDLRYGDIIVHLMEGVLMDADFEQSFSSSPD